MKRILKQYSMALLFLFLVIFLMLGATLGVKSLGDKLLEESEHTDMKPTGTSIN